MGCLETGMHLYATGVTNEPLEAVYALREWAIPAMNLWGYAETAWRRWTDSHLPLWHAPSGECFLEEAPGRIAAVMGPTRTNPRTVLSAIWNVRKLTP